MPVTTRFERGNEALGGNFCTSPRHDGTLFSHETDISSHETAIYHSMACVMKRAPGHSPYANSSLDWTNCPE